VFHRRSRHPQPRVLRPAHCPGPVLKLRRLQLLRR
jgi:hypothetical protein